MKNFTNTSFLKETALLLFLIFFFTSAYTQSSIWKAIHPDNVPIQGERRIVTTTFELFEIDTVSLKEALMAAPHESEIAVNQSTTELSLPRPDGEWETFHVVTYDMMEAPLQERWWYLHTWRGVSKDNPLSTIRLDWTVKGFHAMVFEPGNTWAIDPYFWDNNVFYQSHFKRDYPAPTEVFECGVRGDVKPFVPSTQALEKAGDCQFRTYRLALACTGEYATYHGGTEAGAASAFVTSMNRVNGVYEKDLAFRLVLVANNNNLIFLDANTDPYTNNNGSAMLGQNQATCDDVSIMGTANYDIGHVFSTGGGGIASLRSPCTSTRKAQGVTGQSAPVGDFFDIDYVSHEMGHQYGGNHTQNNNCNRSSASMEPGSASSIMGYAGICSPNVQSNSDDYYHGVNIQEIANYMETGGGNSCSTIIDVSNGNPTIPVAGMDHTIPISTPFVLTGAANDPDGDPLTYCWEQYDNEVGAVMPPASTNTQGPMFRTFSPVSDTKRYFPRLSDLVNNVDYDWEELPSVSRDMDFRVTVRDFDGTYGCTTEDNILLSVDDSGGPFLVTTPNTNVTWNEGSSASVNWDVAGTTAAPISCANVDILLSYDGGLTYPTILEAGTANDGSTTITVPAGTSSSARVMVVCSDNVFFDISDVNFTIDVAAAPDYVLTYSGGPQVHCFGNNTDVSFVVNTAGLGGYSDPITFALNSPPSGVSANYSVNPVLPNNDVTITVSGLSGLPVGNLDFTFNATSIIGNKTIDLPVQVINSAAAASLIGPSNSATNESIFPTYSWNVASNSDEYYVEIASDNAFSSIVETATVSTTTFTPSVALTGDTDYFWRVTSINTDCGQGGQSSEWQFRTESCYFYASTDVPKTISSGSPANYSSTLTIPHYGTITDVDVINLKATHTWVNDLSFTLEAPDGGSQELFSYICGNVDNVDITIDSESGNAISCPLDQQQKAQTESGSLSSLYGKEMNNTWTLDFRDNANQDGGSLTGWGIRVCTNNFSILPVEWLTFNALPTKNSILLDWSTGLEENNAGFDIERRAEYEVDYKSIGWIDATEEPKVENHYTYIDNKALAGVMYYYRVRQVDYSGYEDYSRIRRAQIFSAKPVVQLYPNPTSDLVELRLLGDYENLIVRLFDSNGRLVKQLNWDDRAANIQIDLSMLPIGVYAVCLQIDDDTQVRRIVVER